MKCKFCGKEDKRANCMQGYCQVCYKYFVLEGKQVYDIPKFGEMVYVENGDVVCNICGKAFRKLGGHLYQAHNLTSKEAFVQFGWFRNAKATNENYRKYMKDIIQPKCINDNLLEKGKPTRLTKGNKLRKGTGIPMPKIIKLIEVD